MIRREGGAKKENERSIRIDKQAIKTWIYPTNYPIRQYQLDISQKALFQNTLVCLPTGLGKTLIAAVIIYNYYRWYSPINGKIIFMAPTRPLVNQQLHACQEIMLGRTIIPVDEIAYLEGTIPIEKRAAIWKEKRIFFCTPQTALNDLKNGNFPPSLVSSLVCVVVDEAHKATGNYAYTTFIEALDAIGHREYRLLALSATPGSDLKKIQEVVRNLKINHIEIRTEDDPEILPYIHKKEIEIVKCDDNDDDGEDGERGGGGGGRGKVGEKSFLQQVKDEIHRCMMKPLEELQSHNLTCSTIPQNMNRFVLSEIEENLLEYLKEETSWKGQFEKHLKDNYQLLKLLVESKRILSSGNGGGKTGKASSSSSSSFFTNSEYKELLAFLDQQMKLYNNVNNHFIHQSLQRLYQLVKKFTSLTSSTSSSTTLRALIKQQPKIAKLREILFEHFHEFSQRGETTRVIVFVHLRTTVMEVKEELLKIPKERNIKPREFIGQASSSSNDINGTSIGLSQAEQQQILKQFNSGIYNVLIATSVAEEGLDIAEVDLIVLLDSVASPTRFVQRCGRTGRQRSGRVVLITLPSSSTTPSNSNWATSNETDEDKLENSYKSIQKLNEILRRATQMIQFYPNNPCMIPREFALPTVEFKKMGQSDGENEERNENSPKMSSMKASGNSITNYLTKNPSQTQTSQQQQANTKLSSQPEIIDFSNDDEEDPFGFSFVDPTEIPASTTTAAKNITTRPSEHKTSTLIPPASKPTEIIDISLSQTMFPQPQQQQKDNEFYFHEDEEDDRFTPEILPIHKVQATEDFEYFTDNNFNFHQPFHYDEIIQQEETRIEEIVEEKPIIKAPDEPTALKNSKTPFRSFSLKNRRYKIICTSNPAQSNFLPPDLNLSQSPLPKKTREIEPSTYSSAIDEIVQKNSPVLAIKPPRKLNFSPTQQSGEIPSHSSSNSKMNMKFQQESRQCAICLEFNTKKTNESLLSEDEDEKSSGDEEEMEEIIRCNGPCGSYFHLSCYCPGEDIDDLDAGDFTCAFCTSLKYPSSKNSSASNAMKCALCYQNTGLMKQTTCDQFAHLCCVLFTPELTTDDHTGQPNNLNALQADRKNLLCRCCLRRGGAIIQCQYADCMEAFHPYCVFSHQERGQLVIWRRKKENRYDLFCAQHEKFIPPRHLILSILKPLPTTINSHENINVMQEETIGTPRNARISLTQAELMDTDEKKKKGQTALITVDNEGMIVIPKKPPKRQRLKKTLSSQEESSDNSDENKKLRNKQKRKEKNLFSRSFYNQKLANCFELEAQVSGEDDDDDDKGAAANTGGIRRRAGDDESETEDEEDEVLSGDFINDGCYTQPAGESEEGLMTQCALYANVNRELNREIEEKSENFMDANGNLRLEHLVLRKNHKMFEQTKNATNIFSAENTPNRKRKPSVKNKKKRKSFSDDEEEEEDDDDESQEDEDLDGFDSSFIVEDDEIEYETGAEEEMLKEAEEESRTFDRPAIPFTGRSKKIRKTKEEERRKPTLLRGKD